MLKENLQKVVESLKLEKDIIRIWTANNSDYFFVTSDNVCVVMYSNGTGNVFDESGNPLFKKSELSGTSLDSWIRGSNPAYSLNHGYYGLPVSSLLVLFTFEGEKEKFDEWCKKNTH